MRNQAVRRDDMAVGRRNDRDDFYEQGDASGLRGGYHYADGQHAQQHEEPDYDPRAYAPNPDEPYGYDDNGDPLYYEHDAPKLKGGRGGLLMVGAVLAVALIGGAGAVGYKMLSPGGLSGEPPLIKAESEPVKTVPEKSAESAQQNKAVYDRIDPVNAPKAKVVSREEQPVDLPSAPSSEPRGDGARIILPGGPAAAGPTAPGTMGSEPRKVKTVAIRPDAPIAPQQPAQKPADPIAEAARTGRAPAGSEFDNGIIADGGAPSPRTAAAPNPAARPAPAPAARPAPAPQAARPAPVPVAPAPAAPVPAAPVAAAQRSDPAQVAAVAPRAPAPAAAARPTAAGGFVVQVTSQRSEADARTAYSSLQKRFPQVLGPYQPSIQSATIADRGTYYRVRVGPFASNTDASTVCNNLRAAGGDCVVARN